MYRADTIVARATAPGRSAVAIVRLSGPAAFEIASRLLRTRRARDGALPWRLSRYDAIDPTDDGVLDDVLAVRMPGPKTYTGEDVVEIHCHGSPVIVERLVGAALSAGARGAEPGEFTRRAVLNGRMDLLQAEAVVDLIDAPVLSGVKAACRQLEGSLSSRIREIRAQILEVLADVEAHIDFTDDDVAEEDATVRVVSVAGIVEALDKLTRGFHAQRREREGYRVVLSGRPNVGKSSLFNALLGFARAIVADECGTTRDSIEETVDTRGWAFVLTDTAGMRDTDSVSETAAVERSRAAAEAADICVCVVDGSLPLTGDDLALIGACRASGETLCVLNKSDLGDGTTVANREYLAQLGLPLLRISALEPGGAEALQHALIRAAKRIRGDTSPPAGLTRERHHSAAERTRAALDRATVLLTANEQSELAAVELRDALRELAAVTDPLDNEHVLDRIFAEFCVGK
jgi:tRNA modification GTPase